LVCFNSSGFLERLQAAAIFSNGIGLVVGGKLEWLGKSLDLDTVFTSVADSHSSDNLVGIASSKRLDLACELLLGDADVEPCEFSVKTKFDFSVSIVVVADSGTNTIGSWFAGCVASGSTLVPDNFPRVCGPCNFKGSEELGLARWVETGWELEDGVHEDALGPSIWLVIDSSCNWSNGVVSAPDELGSWHNCDFGLESAELGRALSTAGDV
jgi:hypothetical protein